MKWVLHIVLICLFQAGLAQSIDLQLISSAGSTSVKNQLSWSLGESVIDGASRLTQGFHQGNLLITSTIDNFHSEILKIYPNPSRDQLHIEISTESKLIIELIDVEGKIMTSRKASYPAIKLDLEAYEAGLYFVRIRGDNITPSTHKIIKIR